MEEAKAPNRLLAAVMEQAGLSNKGLAARIRTEAANLGLAVSPDHVSVRRWLDGTRPRSDAARCIAAALSSKLGRRVTLAELGMESAGGDVVEGGAEYPAEPSEAVDRLETLAAADLADSPSVAAAKWVPATAPGVITGYLFADTLGDGEGSAIESGAGVAGRITATVRNLTDLDFQFGGGHSRSMMLFYWKSEIVPALRQRQPEPVRRAIFRAAADAAEVLGWTAYDAGRHWAAQSYFVQGLRLAKEAADPLMGGMILSNLSHQANYLGNFAEAAQYARAAQTAIARMSCATVNAMFFAMEARALASIGDERGCIGALHRAEQEFERQNPDDDPDWISYFDRLELAGEAAHCFRDLGKARETQHFAAQAVDAVLTPPRTRAFIGMVNAAGALQAGNLDEALSLATESVTLSGSLQSDRYVRYIADFHRSIHENHARESTVREFSGFLAENNPKIHAAR